MTITDESTTTARLERDQESGFPPAPPPAGAGFGHGAPRGGRRGRLIAAVIAASLGSGLLGGAVGGYLTDGPTASPAAPVEVNPEALSRSAGSISALAGEALKSTVTIQTPTAQGAALGSGFVYEPGKILTNAHVVANGGGDGIRVTLPDGRQVTARLAGLSTTYDLAVLELEDDGGVPALPLGNSDTTKAGDDVLAVGSPHGLNNTVTSGIVSATNRPWPAGNDSRNGQKYMSALQTDAAINSGNSGGPLINGQGQVVGINTSIETSGRNPGGGQPGNIGLGFAIPINQAKRVADQLAAGEKAAYPVIGVRLRTPEPPGGSAGPSGAVVGDVESGSGAADAGLRAGDVITKVDGTPVTTSEELMAALWRKAPGEAVKITYTRDGSPETTGVKLTAQPVS